MQQKTIYIFGNPDLAKDSLPIRIIPDLQKRFPQHIFTILDPNEEWGISNNLTILDTVVGIDTVTEFHDLNTFLQTPRVTCHDFDAYTNLLFLKKLRKIDSVHIIGVPPTLSKEKTIEKVSTILMGNSY